MEKHSGCICMFSLRQQCVCLWNHTLAKAVCCFFIFFFPYIVVTQHAAYFHEEHQGRWPSVPKHTTQTDVDAVDCMRNSPSCQVEFRVTNCRLWKQESLVDITELFLELFHDWGEKNNIAFLLKAQRGCTSLGIIYFLAINTFCYPLNVKRAPRKTFLLIEIQKISTI